MALYTIAGQDSAWPELGHARIPADTETGNRIGQAYLCAWACSHRARSCEWQLTTRTVATKREVCLVFPEGGWEDKNRIYSPAYLIKPLFPGYSHTSDSLAP